MTTLYKLTDYLDQTYNETQWGENVTHITNGQGGLCGPGWIHAYLSPELAILLNPTHGNFLNPHLWLARGEIGIRDGEFKVGTTCLTTIRQIPIPIITAEQRIIFAINCAKQVYIDPLFIQWADNWLNNVDRTERSAQLAAAESATQSATQSAAWSAQLAQLAAAAAAAARSTQLAWSTQLAQSAQFAAGAAKSTIYTAAAPISLITIAKESIK